MGLASHSQGSGAKRRIIIYPKTLYKDKQAKEARDNLKERQKLVARLKDQNFPPQIPDVPISTRDRMIKEIWCEIKGLPKPTYADVWDGPIEPKIQEIKLRMKEFEDKARKQKEEWEKEEAAKASAATTQETSTPKKAKGKPKT